MPAVPPTAPVALAAPAALQPLRLLARGVRSFLPWTSDAVLRLVITNGIGLAMIITSWYLTSGQTHLHDQMGWLKLGIVGLLLCGAANGIWLLRGRQAVGLARVALLERYAPAVPSTRAGAAPVATVDTGDDTLVAGASMTRFHRSSCPLVADKPVAAASRAEHEAAGRQPCELCLS